MDVRVVCHAGVERHERLPMLRRPRLEERVERLLPRSVVDQGGLRQHTVEVEKAGGHMRRKSQHGLNVVARGR